MKEWFRAISDTARSLIVGRPQQDEHQHQNLQNHHQQHTPISTQEQSYYPISQIQSPQQPSHIQAHVNQQKQDQRQQQAYINNQQQFHQETQKKQFPKHSQQNKYHRGQHNNQQRQKQQHQQYQQQTQRPSSHHQYDQYENQYRQASNSLPNHSNQFLAQNPLSPKEHQFDTLNEISTHLENLSQGHSPFQVGFTNQDVQIQPGGYSPADIPIHGILPSQGEFSEPTNLHSRNLVQNPVAISPNSSIFHHGYLHPSGYPMADTQQGNCSSPRLDQNKIIPGSTTVGYRHEDIYGRFPAAPKQFVQQDQVSFQQPQADINPANQYVHNPIPLLQTPQIIFDPTVPPPNIFAHKLHPPQPIAQGTQQHFATSPSPMFRQNSSPILSQVRPMFPQLVGKSANNQTPPLNTHLIPTPSSIYSQISVNNKEILSLDGCKTINKSVVGDDKKQVGAIRLSLNQSCDVKRSAEKNPPPQQVVPKTATPKPITKTKTLQNTGKDKNTNDSIKLETNLDSLVIAPEKEQYIADTYPIVRDTAKKNKRKKKKDPMIPATIESMVEEKTELKKVEISKVGPQIVSRRARNRNNSSSSSIEKKSLNGSIKYIDHDVNTNKLPIQKFRKSLREDDNTSKHSIHNIHYEEPLNDKAAMKSQIKHNEEDLFTTVTSKTSIEGCDLQSEMIVSNDDKGIVKKCEAVHVLGTSTGTKQKKKQKGKTRGPSNEEQAIVSVMPDTDTPNKLDTSIIPDSITMSNTRNEHVENKLVNLEMERDEKSLQDIKKYIIEHVATSVKKKAVDQGQIVSKAPIHSSVDLSLNSTVPKASKQSEHCANENIENIHGEALYSENTSTLQRVVTLTTSANDEENENNEDVANSTKALEGQSEATAGGGNIKSNCGRKCVRFTKCSGITTSEITVVVPSLQVTNDKATGVEDTLGESDDLVRGLASNSKDTSEVATNVCAEKNHNKAVKQELRGALLNDERTVKKNCHKVTKDVSLNNNKESSCKVKYNKINNINSEIKPVELESVTSDEITDLCHVPVIVREAIQHGSDIEEIKNRSRSNSEQRDTNVRVSDTSLAGSLHTTTTTTATTTAATIATVTTTTATTSLAVTKQETLNVHGDKSNNASLTVSVGNGKHNGDSELQNEGVNNKNIVNFPANVRDIVNEEILDSNKHEHERVPSRIPDSECSEKIQRNIESEFSSNEFSDHETENILPRINDDETTNINNSTNSQAGYKSGEKSTVVENYTSDNGHSEKGLSVSIPTQIKSDTDISDNSFEVAFESALERSDSGANFSNKRTIPEKAKETSANLEILTRNEENYIETITNSTGDSTFREETINEGNMKEEDLNPAASSVRLRRRRPLPEERGEQATDKQASTADSTNVNDQNSNNDCTGVRRRRSRVVAEEDNTEQQTLFTRRRRSKLTETGPSDNDVTERRQSRKSSNGDYCSSEAIEEIVSLNDYLSSKEGNDTTNNIQTNKEDVPVRKRTRNIDDVSKSEGQENNENNIPRQRRRRTIESEDGIRNEVSNNSVENFNDHNNLNNLSSINVEKVNSISLTTEGNVDTNTQPTVRRRRRQQTVESTATSEGNEPPEDGGDNNGGVVRRRRRRLISTTEADKESTTTVTQEVELKSEKLQRTATTDALEMNENSSCDDDPRQSISSLSQPHDDIENVLTAPTKENKADELLENGSPTSDRLNGVSSSIGSDQANVPTSPRNQHRRTKRRKKVVCDEDSDVPDTDATCNDGEVRILLYVPNHDENMLLKMSNAGSSIFRIIDLYTIRPQEQLYVYFI